MSRRSVPRIAPADLRDHAEEARIDRVWARLEPDLAVAPAAIRRPVFASLAFAAALSAFAGGILVGKVAFQAPALTAIAPVQSSERTTVDVLAAGSEGRSFPLPGGGQLMLQPGATVEVERAGGALTLKLLQGAASVDTIGAQRVAGLIIIAGDAQLNAQGGSVLNVTRNQDDINVNVSDGAVSLTTSGVTQKLARGQTDHIPIHATISMASPTASPAVRSPLLASRARQPNQARIGKPAIAEGPSWLTSYANADDTAALALLRQQPGGLQGAIAGARSAHELVAIGTIAHGKGGDPSAEFAAYKSAVDRFPEDVNAQLAAMTLAHLYEAAGNKALAAEYLERGAKLRGPLAENALCRQIKGERLAGHKDEALRQAKEYVAKYPDGPCKDELELAQQEDDGAGGSSSPAAPPATVAPPSGAPAPSGGAAP